MSLEHDLYRLYLTEIDRSRLLSRLRARNDAPAHLQQAFSDVKGGIKYLLDEGLYTVDDVFTLLSRRDALEAIMLAMDAQGFIRPSTVEVDDELRKSLKSLSWSRLVPAADIEWPDIKQLESSWWWRIAHESSH